MSKEAKSGSTGAYRFDHFTRKIFMKFQILREIIIDLLGKDRRKGMIERQARIEKTQKFADKKNCLKDKNCLIRYGGIFNI